MNKWLNFRRGLAKTCPAEGPLCPFWSAGLLHSRGLTTVRVLRRVKPLLPSLHFPKPGAHGIVCQTSESPPGLVTTELPETVRTFLIATAIKNFDPFFIMACGPPAFSSMSCWAPSNTQNSWLPTLLLSNAAGKLVLTHSERWPIRILLDGFCIWTLPGVLAVPCRHKAGLPHTLERPSYAKVPNFQRPSKTKKLLSLKQHFVGSALIIPSKLRIRGECFSMLRKCFRTANTELAHQPAHQARQAFTSVASSERSHPYLW